MACMPHATFRELQIAALVPLKISVYHSPREIKKHPLISGSSRFPLVSQAVELFCGIVI
jgi:hypothetical protein